MCVGAAKYSLSIEQNAFIGPLSALVPRPWLEQARPGGAGMPRYGPMPEMPNARERLVNRAHTVGEPCGTAWNDESENDGPVIG